MSDKFRVISFDALRYGEEFLFSLRDRNSFKKLGDSSYISLCQSAEISDLEPGQLVFIKNLDVTIDLTKRKK